MPERIQLKRSRGWRMPPGAMSVARPGRWGNPYPVGVFGLHRALQLFENTLAGQWTPGLFAADEPDALVHRAYQAHCHWRARHGAGMSMLLDELRGRDLACWCALPAAGQPDLCHAALLLRLANAHSPVVGGCGASPATAAPEPAAADFSTASPPARPCRNS